MLMSSKTSNTVEKQMEPAFHVSVHPQTRVKLWFWGFFSLYVLLYDEFYNNDQCRLGKN